MSYECFKAKVNALIRRSGEGIVVKFSNNSGKHYAVCSNGTTITGNPSSLKITVKWGKNHMSMATI